MACLKPYSFANSWNSLLLNWVSISETTYAGIPWTPIVSSTLLLQHTASQRLHLGNLWELAAIAHRE